MRAYGQSTELKSRMATADSALATPASFTGIRAIAQRTNEGRAQERKEAESDTAELKNRQVSLEKLSDRAKRIIMLPTKTLFPEPEYSFPASYSYLLNKKSRSIQIYNHLLPKKIVSKDKRKVSASTDMSLPNDPQFGQYQLDFFGDRLSRSVTYTLVKGGYEWQPM